MSEEMMEKNENVFNAKVSDGPAGTALTDDELQEVAGGRGVWMSNINYSKEWASYFSQWGTVYYHKGNEEILCYVWNWRHDDFLWDGKFMWFDLISVRTPKEYYTGVSADKVWVNYKD